MPDQNAMELFRSAINKARQGDTDAARTLLEESIRRDPNHDEVWYAYATLANTQREKLLSLKKALELNPQNSRALNMVQELGVDPDQLIRGRPATLRTQNPPVQPAAARPQQPEPRQPEPQRPPAADITSTQERRSRSTEGRSRIAPRVGGKRITQEMAAQKRATGEYQPIAPELPQREMRPSANEVRELISPKPAAPEAANLTWDIQQPAPPREADIRRSTQSQRVEQQPAQRPTPLQRQAPVQPAQEVPSAPAQPPQATQQRTKRSTETGLSRRLQAMKSSRSEERATQTGGLRALTDAASPEPLLPQDGGIDDPVTTLRRITSEYETVEDTPQGYTTSLDTPEEDALGADLSFLETGMLPAELRGTSLDEIETLGNLEFPQDALDEAPPATTRDLSFITSLMKAVTPQEINQSLRETKNAPETEAVERDDLSWLDVLPAVDDEAPAPQEADADDINIGDTAALAMAEDTIADLSWLDALPPMGDASFSLEEDDPTAQRRSRADAPTWQETDFSISEAAQAEGTLLDWMDEAPEVEARAAETYDPLNDLDQLRFEVKEMAQAEPSQFLPTADHRQLPRLETSSDDLTDITDLLVSFDDPDASSGEEELRAPRDLHGITDLLTSFEPAQAGADPFVEEVSSGQGTAEEEIDLSWLIDPPTTTNTPLPKATAKPAPEQRTGSGKLKIPDDTIDLSWFDDLIPPAEELQQRNEENRKKKADEKQRRRNR